MISNPVLDAFPYASPSVRWVMRKQCAIMREQCVGTPEFRQAMKRLHKLADIVMKNKPEGIQPPPSPVTPPVIREGLRVRILSTGYVIHCLDVRTAYDVEQFALAVHAAAFAAGTREHVAQTNTPPQAEQWYCTGQPYEWRNDPWEGNRS